MKRRTFLKLSGGTAALAANGSLLATAPRPFPAIPSLADLASARMPHTFMKLFYRPIAMNDWGYAQAVKSVSAISAMGFPSYACCGIPDVPLSPGFLRMHAVRHQRVVFYFPRQRIRPRRGDASQIRTACLKSHC